MSLNDPERVRAQYASEQGLAARRSVYERITGPSPDEVAFAAVVERRPRAVLEVGCGQGALSKRLADELESSVVAVDQSERMVELARGLGVEARVADIQALPFADGTFACALAHFMLYHVPDLDRGLAEVSRVLRPGGRLVATTNGRDHLLEMWELVGAAESRLAREIVFSAENGERALRLHFASVESRSAAGTVDLPGRDGVVRYLASTSTWRHLADRVPDTLPDAFTARRSTVVFVAEKAA